jgi:hypothetical protein
MTSSTRLNAGVQRFVSSSVGQWVLVLGGAAVVGLVALPTPPSISYVFVQLMVATLWVHCVEPPLRYFRVPRSVLWFAAAWSIFEFVLMDVFIASELATGFHLSRLELLVGSVLTLAYVAIVGLSFWPKYSILVRLFGRPPEGLVL